MGVFQQAVAERFVGHRFTVAKDPWNQPTDSLNHHRRSNLSPGQDVIADRDLVINQVAADPFVNPLEAAAKEAEAARTRQGGGVLLTELPASRRQIDQGPGWLYCLHGVKDRFRFEDHARSPAKGSTIDRPVDIGSGIANIVNPNIQHAITSGLADETGRSEPLNNLRQDGQHIDAHRASQSGLVGHGFCVIEQPRWNIDAHRGVIMIAVEAQRNQPAIFQLQEI